MRSPAPGTLPFRIVEVASTGDLTLDSVTLDNGDATGTAFNTGQAAAFTTSGS
jgi:hypothetical protein